MVRPLLFIALIATAIPAQAAASEALERTFAERTALLATDQRCGLFAGPIRAALEAGAAQARSALLRTGWTNARADALATRARDLSQRHRCDAAPVTAAAQSAKSGFAAFTRLPLMRFPGATATWTARRAVDMDGWLAFQDLPEKGRFGLRYNQGSLEAAFALPLAERASAPASARLILRDARKAPTSPLDIPNRPVGGLANNAPHPGMAEQILARARSVVMLETPGAGRAAIFAFPVDSLQRIARLDPREAAVIELETARGPQRFLIEIGDLAAALAFLRAG